MEVHHAKKYRRREGEPVLKKVKRTLGTPWHTMAQKSTEREKRGHRTQKMIKYLKRR